MKAIANPIVLLSLAAGPRAVRAFSSDRATPASARARDASSVAAPAPVAAPASSRRSFLDALLLVSTTASALLPSAPADAAVLDPARNGGGTLQDLAPDEAERRFRDGRETVSYLLTNYDAICDGGGDNVRRYLGTVGTGSGLFGISKAMKALSERADDIVECECCLAEGTRSNYQRQILRWCALTAATGH